MRKIGAFLENAALAFLVVLMLSVAAQIVMRNVFNSGSIVIEELARFSLISLVFLMLPVLTLERKHIVVDIVLLQLPPRVRRVFDIFIHVLMTAFSVFILVAISQIMRRNWNVRTPAIRMPNAVFYLPVTIGIAATLAASIRQLAGIITNRERGA